MFKQIVTKEDIDTGRAQLKRRPLRGTAKLATAGNQ
jgi:hypothetical protein